MRLSLGMILFDYVIIMETNDGWMLNSNLVIN
jgi:hypothetical protein